MLIYSVLRLETVGQAESSWPTVKLSDPEYYGLSDCYRLNNVLDGLRCHLLPTGPEQTKYQSGDLGGIYDLCLTTDRETPQQPRYLT